MMRSSSSFLFFVFVVTVVSAARAGDLPDDARLRLGDTRFRTVGDVRDAAVVAQSPDGKRLAVLGIVPGHPILLLLDAATGNEIKRIPIPEGVGVFRQIAFTNDNKCVTLGEDRIGICEVDSEHWIKSKDVLPNVADDLVATLPDGKLVVAGVIDDEESKKREMRTAGLWDANANTIGVRYAATQSPACLRLSANGKVFATKGWMEKGTEKEKAELDRTVQIWDVATGKELRRIKVGGEWHGVAISPDAALLVVATDVLTVVDLKAGKETALLATLAVDHVLTIRFSADGKRLAASSSLGQFQVWEMPSGKRLGGCDAPKEDCYFPSVAFLPGGKVRAASVWHKTVVMWDAVTGEMATLPAGHAATVETLAFSRDGKTLVSFAEDGLRRWDTSTGHEMPANARRTSLKATEKILPLLSPDGRFTISYEFKEKIWSVIDTATGERICRRELHGKLPLAFPDAAIGEMNVSLVTNESDLSQDDSVASLALWDLATGRKSRVVKVEDKKLFPELLALSPDGRSVAIIHDFNRQPQVLINGQNPEPASPYHLTMLDAQTGKARWRISLTDRLHTLPQFSPDGAHLAALMENETVHVWNVATGTDFLTLATGDDVKNRVVAFSRDGRMVAVGGCTEKGAGVLRLWECAMGRMRAEFRTPDSGIRCLAFAPDNRTLASGGEDTSILLWDLVGDRKATVAKLQPAEVAALWNDLADNDAAKAYRSMQRLWQHPAEAVALIQAKQPPAPAPKITSAEIDQLIADLDHDDFERREKAARALAAC